MADTFAGSMRTLNRGFTDAGDNSRRYLRRLLGFDPPLPEEPQPQPSGPPRDFESLLDQYLFNDDPAKIAEAQRRRAEAAAAPRPVPTVGVSMESLPPRGPSLPPVPQLGVSIPTVLRGAPNPISAGLDAKEAAAGRALAAQTHFAPTAPAGIGGKFGYMDAISGKTAPFGAAPQTEMEQLTERIKQHVARKAMAQAANQDLIAGRQGRLADAQRRAAALGYDRNGQPYRDARVPASLAAPPVDNSYAGVSAAAVARDPRLATREGVDFGSFSARVGEDGLVHAQRDGETPDMRFVNSVGHPGIRPNFAANAEAYKARRQAREDGIAQHRQQFFADRRQAAQNAQAGREFMAFINGVDPRDRGTVLSAVAQAQSDKYAADLEAALRREELPVKRDLARAQGITAVGGIDGVTLDNLDDAAGRLGLAMTPNPSGSRSGAPSPAEVQGRIAAARGTGGEKETRGPATPDEILDQLTPEHARAMTRDGILKFGLTEDALLKRIGELEDEAQHKKWLGRHLSGPDSEPLFGIGTRSPEEVQRAVRRLQVANTLLNVFRGAYVSR